MTYESPLDNPFASGSDIVSGYDPRDRAIRPIPISGSMMQIGDMGVPRVSDILGFPQNIEPEEDDPMVAPELHALGYSGYYDEDYYPLVPLRRIRR